MSIIGFILLCFFIVFIVVPLLRAVLGVRRMRRDWQQRVDDFRRAAGFGPASAPADEPKAPARKKKIDPDTGEYVAFEEIKAETTYTSASTETQASFRVEEQIEDVSWEDIK